MTHKSGVHNSVAGADHEAAHWVPCKSDSRFKLPLRGIKRRIGRVDAELLPLCSERIEERIAVVGLVERLVILIAQSQIQRQFRCDLEVILNEERIGPCTR